MTDRTIAVPDGVCEAAVPLRSLDRRWLLALYAVVPVTGGVMVFDRLVLGSYLQRSALPAAPEDWAVWTVLFGMPHVIAGLLTMADREYLGHYRRRFRWPALGFGAVSLAAAIGPASFGLLVTLWLALYTVTHLLTQQIGLAFTMLVAPPRRWMRVWKSVLLTSGLLLYAGLYLDTNLPGASFAGLDPHALVVLACAALMLPLVVATAVLARHAGDRCAIGFVWANCAMPAGVLAAYVWRYPVFILLIPRVIHDVTAYLVYFNHDSNRNARYRHNLLYRRCQTEGRVAFWILPAVSMGLAHALQISDFPLFVAMNFFLTFMHYHIESVVWRRPHPHRRFLLLS